MRFEIFVRRYLAPVSMKDAGEVGFAKMLKLLSQPAGPARGARYITRTEESGPWIKTYLSGHADPVYWPKDDNFAAMQVMVGEQFDPGDWHRYLIPETSVHSGDVVVDCGAAEGLFSFLVAPVAKEVHAVEPMPKFLEAMRLTFVNLPNIKIVP